MFICVDGEGASERNSYFLLADSTGKSVHGENLSRTQILDFLFSLPASKKKIMFGLTYDANMWLRALMLPRKILERISKCVPTHFRIGSEEYIVHFVPRKKFVISKKNESGKYDAVTLTDIYGFFQSSLVGAMGRNAANFTNLEKIAIYKARRAQFDYKDLAGIKRYCIWECCAADKLVEEVREVEKLLGVNIREYSGAGSFASAILRKLIPKPDPDKFLAYGEDIIDRAYFGGRVEMVRIGTSLRFSLHDINSAYADALVAIASFSHLRLDQVEFDFPAAEFYPLPFRQSNGNVIFPRRGKGWYYSFESLCHPKIEGMKIIKSVAWPNPIWGLDLSILRTYFDLRKKVNPLQARIIKLGLAALYGKFAQHRGNHGNPYFSRLIAGAVTSYVRSRLYFRAKSFEEEGICAFATDSILTEHRPMRDTSALCTGEGLGQWRQTEGSHLLTAQPGVYFFEEEGGIEKKATRGFEKNMLDRFKIIEFWKSNGSDRMKNIMPLEATRFVTLPSALTGNFSDWGKWVKEKIEFDLTGESEKRTGFVGKWNPWERAVLLNPAENLSDEESAPYTAHSERDQSDIREEEREEFLG